MKQIRSPWRWLWMLIYWSSYLLSLSLSRVEQLGKRKSIWDYEKYWGFRSKIYLEILHFWTIADGCCWRSLHFWTIADLSLFKIFLKFCIGKSVEACGDGRGVICNNRWQQNTCESTNPASGLSKFWRDTLRKCISQIPSKRDDARTVPDPKKLAKILAEESWGDALLET